MSLSVKDGGRKHMRLCVCVFLCVCVCVCVRSYHHWAHNCKLVVQVSCLVNVTCLECDLEHVMHSKTSNHLANQITEQPIK